MPHALLPDQETAEEALRKAMVFHAAESKATWRGEGFVRAALEKLENATRGLKTLEKLKAKP